MAKDNNNPNQQQPNLNLDISLEVAQGVYSNLAVISHTPAEIVLDFAQVLPGTQNANVRSRVIMHPLHAKRLMMALADNLQKFENQYGKIVEPTPRAIGDTVPYDMIGKA
ncbi:MAG: DUF3467 domain-containing protein [Bacteroidales bacterium]|nr:DUF3467 domain-containing protein [Bacteroidales bacterium]